MARNMNRSAFTTDNRSLISKVEWFKSRCALRFGSEQPGPQRRLCCDSSNQATVQAARVALPTGT